MIFTADKKGVADSLSLSILLMLLMNNLMLNSKGTLLLSRLFGYLLRAWNPLNNEPLQTGTYFLKALGLLSLAPIQNH